MGVSLFQPDGIFTAVVLSYLLKPLDLTVFGTLICLPRPIRSDRPGSAVLPLHIAPLHTM